MNSKKKEIIYAVIWGMITGFSGMFINLLVIPITGTFPLVNQISSILCIVTGVLAGTLIYCIRKPKPITVYEITKKEE